jgi:hypothetical protein
MEIQQLQLTIEREIQARQQVEKQFRQVKSEFMDQIQFVFWLVFFDG